MDSFQTKAWYQQPKITFLDHSAINFKYAKFKDKEFDALSPKLLYITWLV